MSRRKEWSALIYQALPLVTGSAVLQARIDMYEKVCLDPYAGSGSTLVAHGGLTFAEIEPCTEHEDGQGFWFGFDCAHSGDASYDPNNLPEHEKKFRARNPELYTSAYRMSEHYWSEAEVAAESERLAEQLAAMA